MNKEYKFLIGIEAKVNENKNFPEHVHAEELLYSIIQSAIAQKMSLQRKAIIDGNIELVKALESEINMIESVKIEIKI